MKILASLLFLTVTTNVIAAPIWTDTIDPRVIAGYPDGSIVFLPRDLTTVENPANCDDPLGYVIESDHDVQGALSILVGAKTTGDSIYFSVRDDKCHIIQQTDGGQELPVVQRIGF